MLKKPENIHIFVTIA